MIIQTGKSRANANGDGGGRWRQQCCTHTSSYLRIETLRIAIENDIDATPPRGGNDTMLGSKVDSYDGHDDASIFSNNNKK
jgi:hypothetical protein